MWKSAKDCNKLFCDNETGGLDPEKCSITETAFILTDPSGERVIEEFSARVFPDKPVESKAAEINGYTLEKWATTAVPISSIIPKIASLSRGAIFCSHNAPFDWGFIEPALKAQGARWGGDYHKACTVAMSMPLLTAGLVTNIKLGTLAAFFGIDPGEPHRALSDVRVCRQVFLKLNALYEKSVLEKYGKVAA